MPKIQLREDEIKIDKSFMTGKDRIFLNGKLLFEGKFAFKEIHRFNVDGREYVIERDRYDDILKIYRIQVIENGEVIREGLFDLKGKLVNNIGEAVAAANVRFCQMAGGFVCGISIYFVIPKGIFPGNFLFSAMIAGIIGSGSVMIGALIGYVLGCLLYGKPKA